MLHIEWCPRKISLANKHSGNIWQKKKVKQQHALEFHSAECWIAMYFAKSCFSLLGYLQATPPVQALQSELTGTAPTHVYYAFASETWLVRQGLWRWRFNAITKRFLRPSIRLDLATACCYGHVTTLYALVVWSYLYNPLTSPTHAGGIRRVFATFVEQPMARTKCSSIFRLPPERVSFKYAFRVILDGTACYKPRL